MKPPLRVQIKLRTTPSQIYTALTDTAALETWFAEHAEVDLEAGRYDFWGRYTPENPDRESGRHRIQTQQANKRLQFMWHWHGQATIITYSLHPREDHTILAIEHERGHHGSHTIGDYTMEDFWFLSLENLRRYLDGKPSDARVDFSQPMVGDIEHTIEIDAPASRVFEVLIKPAELERWIARRSTVEPRVDGTYDLGWESMGAMKIVDLEPDHKLAYTMVEMDESESIVTWTLAESGGKTRLTIVHSGFGLDEPNGGQNAGWRNFQGWVRSIAEYGADWEPAIVPIPPQVTSYPRVMEGLQAELIWQ